MVPKFGRSKPWNLPLKLWIALGLLGVITGSSAAAYAGDIKVTIPKRSHLTPVQRLNREGVEELRKKKYERAEALFYRAYLFDPDDPFTLNNLGYISELQGQVDRAQEFYRQANELATDAVIDQSTSKSMQGRPINAALAIPDLPLEINHENVEAVRLLSKGRAPEADVLLQKTLTRDPHNAFSLNNMGVTKEMEGESQEALKYYDAATAAGTNVSAVVTLDRSWRGKPVSEMATHNAKALRARMATQNNLAAQVAELNLRGVSAANRNDLQTAAQDFRQAYRLDPNNAFALNNIGYVAEMEGDRETAQFFYDSASRAGAANMTVGLATSSSAEGLKLFQVAGNSDTKVGSSLTAERDVRRRQRAPVVLMRRDNTIVEEPASPPQNSAPQQQFPQPPQHQ
jgi:Flp pilus assembly protein TadD